MPHGGVNVIVSEEEEEKNGVYSSGPGINYMHNPLLLQPNKGLPSQSPLPLHGRGTGGRRD